MVALKPKHVILKVSVSLLAMVGFTTFMGIPKSEEDTFLSYVVDTKKQDLQLYWKNDSGQIFGSIRNLINHVESKNADLTFAMNGGMYKSDRSPQGLFIQNYKTLSDLDTADGEGNFYLKPNGVFYITKNRNPFICKSTDFKNNGSIKFATQSGPMLVVDGHIHSAFKQGSTNINIRNGVGILPDNRVLFAMSKAEINLHEFAMYFQNAGCKNALYLDGFVSRTFLPEKKWIQTDGNFGVIIGVTQ